MCNRQIFSLLVLRESFTHPEWYVTYKLLEHSVPLGNKHNCTLYLEPDPGQKMGKEAGVVMNGQRN